MSWQRKGKSSIDSLTHPGCSVGCCMKRILLCLCAVHLSRLLLRLILLHHRPQTLQMNYLLLLLLLNQSAPADRPGSCSRAHATRCTGSPVVEREVGGWMGGWVSGISDLTTCNACHPNHPSQPPTHPPTRKSPAPHSNRLVLLSTYTHPPTHPPTHRTS